MKPIIQKIGMMVAMLLSFLSMYAYDFEVDGIYYTVNIGDNPTCEVVHGDHLYEGNVDIPTEVRYKGKTLPVIKIGTMAFNDCINLTSIKIPNTIKCIGWRAFDNCSNLAEITLPSSVDEIDGLAFSGCSGLTSFNIPDKIASIEVGTFENCTSLTAISIPSSVSKIGSSAFENCKSLTEITIPKSVVSIGWDAFSGCDNIVKLNIEDDSEPLLLILEAQDKKTPFGECPISDIHIERNLSYKQNQIGGGGQPDVKGDYNLLLGEFKNTLKRLTIGGHISEIDIRNGYLNDKFKVLEYVKINESVSSVGYSCFAQCASLKAVDIAATVTRISLHAFDECPILLNVISNNLTPPDMDDNAFTSNTYINGRLFVHKEAINAYRTASGWKNFWDIQELGHSGVESAVANPNSIEIGRYNLNGQPVRGDYTGFVIILYSDGSVVRKIQKVNNQL